MNIVRTYSTSKKNCLVTVSWSWDWEQSKSINSGCWLYLAPLGKHCVWKWPVQGLANDSQDGFHIFSQSLLLIISPMHLNLQQIHTSSKENEVLQVTQLFLIITLRTITYWWLTKGQGMCLARAVRRKNLSYLLNDQGYWMIKASH